MSRLKKSWLFVLLYILFIYISLPFARPILSKIYNVFGKKFLEVLVSFLFFLFLGLFLFTKISYKRKLFIIFLGLGVILISFLFLEIPEERIHLVEYGFLGFLIFRLFKKISFLSLLQILFFVFLVGIFDEIIQYFLPNRVGDLRDIFVNFLGGVLGICLSILSKSS